MTEILQTTSHWRSLVIVTLYFGSSVCSGAVQSALERAKAISSSLHVSPSTPENTYFEASGDAEDVLADLRYSLLIRQILESREESEIASGKIVNTQYGSFPGHGMTPCLMINAYCAQGSST